MRRSDMVISKIVSGAQTGVDIASLRAAKSRGVPTGGVMPKGFRTLAGPKPEWAAEFGLVEHASDKYPPRTYQNVRDSDITIRIAVDLNSAGERCTMKAIQQYDKPHIDIQVNRYVRQHGDVLVVERESLWAVGRDIASIADTIGRGLVINFAGNSEERVPGIEVAAEEFVRMIIDAATGGET